MACSETGELKHHSSSLPALPSLLSTSSLSPLFQTASPAPPPMGHSQNRVWGAQIPPPTDCSKAANASVEVRFGVDVESDKVSMENAWNTATQSAETAAKVVLQEKAVVVQADIGVDGVVSADVIDGDIQQKVQSKEMMKEVAESGNDAEDGVDGDTVDID